MSLQRCQEETTSSQFVDWLEYLKKDVNEFHREDYFLAQIAQEIRRTISKNPERVDLKQFLRKFVWKREPKKVDRMAAAMRQKNRILAMFGFGGKRRK